MNTIYFDSTFNDDIRRKNLYDGQIFVFSPSASAIALCEFARGMIEEAFAPLDSREAQHSLPVEKYVEILAKLKPTFIHHPESKKLIQGILKESGCDLTKTYFDVPRLRTATSDGYLTAGIAYAFHPHRDTWYSAPTCQINWWLPIYDITPENAMAFHPQYWSQPIENSSREYNYAQWNKESRKNAAQHIKTDTRKQPRAEEPLELEPQLRLITKMGGMILFSAAQMHSTVPNTSGYTRFSIDFRTVHFDDVMAKQGAANIDSASTGTSLGDFLRSSDFCPISESLVAVYDTPALISISNS
ncbi:phytanoyl-CoA dioxygenase family protein [Nostoc sp. XA013]|nr:phytanoyl-CoA dioxygenase family protein [Nostoc sp. XA013]